MQEVSFPMKNELLQITTFLIQTCCVESGHDV